MFDPQDHPRVFALPPGADFPAQLVSGLHQRIAGRPPHAMAQIDLLLNTARMQRRVEALFLQNSAALLPRLRLVTDLSAQVPLAGLPPATSSLRRRLELAQLIARLIEQDRTLAPRAAIFDLAESLAALMDEMQGEGVPPDQLAQLDVTDESGHWARSLSFIKLIQPYFNDTSAPDPEARQRRAVEHLIDQWQIAPPQNPIIIAGSTGSRGATALLMAAVARLPQGAVILPGFDYEMPDRVWGQLDDALSSEDHPQFRFARLMAQMDLTPDQIMRWTDHDPRAARNRIVSLALRPAPVTDQWMIEGPDLGDLPSATKGLTLIEAKSPRHEALAIALCLRKAADDGKTAALITPDRMLTRQVTAALDRWSLTPDDSAGRPLHLSAPGRFLRHIAALFGERLTAEPLLTLLKHPLCNTGGTDRGPHLRQTREFELWLRRKGPPFITPDTLLNWAAGRDDDETLPWATWLARVLEGLEDVGQRALADHVEHHISLAEHLSSGPTEHPGELWLKEAGVAALKQVTQLRAEAEHGGDMGPRDYQALFLTVITGEVREPVQAHPNIMIWGTLEARVQGADLVILGGLNDGVWPEMPAPDPWLNRRMRQQAGLLLPERRTGLSAHDFQQAVAGGEVILTRALRDAEAETVVSRWVNRLTNLLAGLPGTDGPKALTDMRARGQKWLALADHIEADIPTIRQAPRPAPRPPVKYRPKQLSVTQIKTLIRDPYAIYARHVLRLRPLDPLRQLPDAPLRGTVLHQVFEDFVRQNINPAAPEARNRLLQLAHDTLTAEVPWPTARRIWTAKLERVVDWFLAGEVERRQTATPIISMLEGTGALHLGDVEFTLTGKADRFDLRHDGRLVIYDYKTGTPPKPAEMKYFDKQLLLEAAMAETGAFKGLDKMPVAEVAYIGLGTSPELRAYPLRDADAKDVLDPDETLADLRKLLATFGQHQQGYSSRRAMHKTYNTGDYDHLARFGEWDDSAPPIGEDVA
ncbi:double-strand break repair protein AddB [Oceaniglobus ichthyenteri]|uniref:double-strand break repair protein AddB n=1 Tax=Oceaniglobus ichthyenteri TaxID=2136177 RepID=UPI000D38B966|nr:double-strand break repair protein AddB [Oceaniglobus ichthyenteri]